MVLGKTTVTLFAGYENKRALHTDVHCENSRFLYRTAAALSDMCDADWERRKKLRQVWCHSVACDHSSLSVEMITSQKLKSNRYWSQGMRKHRQPGSCPEARDESQRLGQTLELWLISTDTWTSRTRGRAHNRQGKPRRRAAPWLAVQPKPHSLLGLSSGQQINTCTSTHRCSF